MDSAQLIPILQLCVGGGILVLMLRIAMLVGQYTHRLQTLEQTFEKWAVKVDAIHTDVQEIKFTLRPRPKTQRSAGG